MSWSTRYPQLFICSSQVRSNKVEGLFFFYLFFTHNRIGIKICKLSLFFFLKCFLSLVSSQVNWRATLGRKKETDRWQSFLLSAKDTVCLAVIVSYLQYMYSLSSLQISQTKMCPCVSINRLLVTKFQTCTQLTSSILDGKFFCSILDRVQTDARLVHVWQQW